jgi:hypothetical protein
LLFPLGALARGTSLLVLVVFALVNAALIAVKRTQPAAPGILNIPVWVPVIGLLTSTGLTLFQLLSIG